ncbi:MAG: GGDEF domain-containing protein, partial [Planctomycetaceae bacterium]
MKKCFRKNDLFFRFSGDDFVIILDPVPYAQAFEAIERFRIAVASHDFPQIDEV